MRTKEESEDYRYFQDPDLLPLEVTADWQDEIRSGLPELPAVRRARFVDAGADTVTAGVLVDNDDLGNLFQEAIDAGASGRSVGIWLTGEVVAYSRRNEVAVDDTPLTAEHLIELTTMVDEGKLSSSAAKEVLIAALDGEGTPTGIAQVRDLLQVSDTGAIEVAIDQVLSENADAVEKIRSGDMKPFGFLIGQVMRQMGGNPRRLSSLQGGQETSVSEDLGGTASLRARYARTTNQELRTRSAPQRSRARTPPWLASSPVPPEGRTCRNARGLALPPGSQARPSPLKGGHVKRRGTRSSWWSVRDMPLCFWHVIHLRCAGRRPSTPG